ncbi:MAG TPA: hypothetical protein VK572_12985 [Burkholderiales bacterium]|nr:hypothetical protein [Burkholderiales bacterium]
MLLLVSDSSVLIDLERGGLLETVFQSGLSLVVPDLMYQNELEKHNGGYLKELGLTVVGLTPDEVSLAQDIEDQHRMLSSEDCFALVCGLRPKHILLVGDDRLRKEAATRGVTCHGLLWLLDEILATEKISRASLCEGLTRISRHANTRLPKAEVERRLQNWCS